MNGMIFWKGGVVLDMLLFDVFIHVKMGKHVMLDIKCSKTKIIAFPTFRNDTVSTPGLRVEAKINQPNPGY